MMKSLLRRFYKYAVEDLYAPGARVEWFDTIEDGLQRVRELRCDPAVRLTVGFWFVLYAGEPGAKIFNRAVVTLKWQVCIQRYALRVVLR